MVGKKEWIVLGKSLRGGEKERIITVERLYHLGGGNVYRIGDKVVHPMHGAGVIDSIVQRKVNGQMKDY